MQYLVDFFGIVREQTIAPLLDKYDSPRVSTYQSYSYLEDRHMAFVRMIEFGSMDDVVMFMIETSELHPRFANGKVK